MEIMCEHCGKNPFEGIVPSKGDFPEPVRVCRECSENYPFADRDGFPVFHFKSENGHWYFVFVHKDYLSPYFYPSARPDFKYLDMDRALSGEVNRTSERPLCIRFVPYNYDIHRTDQVLYFAYGSGIDEISMKKRGVRFFKLGIATLFEVRLDFSRPIGKKILRGAPNLRVGGKEDYVMGLLYCLKNEKELRKLDRWSEVAGPKSQSRRILVHLLSNGQPVPALTHIYPDFTEGLKPRSSYLEKLTQILSDRKFPPEWIARIDSFRLNPPQKPVEKVEEIRSLALYE